MARDKASIYIELQSLYRDLYTFQFEMCKCDRIALGNKMLEHCEQAIAYFSLAYEVESQRALLPQIRAMYAEVGATMHPRKFYCQHYSKGLHFLGSYIKFDRVYLANRTIRRAEKKVREFNGLRHKKSHIEDCITSLNSYFGIMKNRNEFKTINRLYGMLSQGWRRYLHLDYDRLCLVANDGYKHNDYIKFKFYGR